MNSISTIARNEFRTAFRERLVVTIAVLFLAISILSVYIGSATKRTELRVYNEAVATLNRNGTVTTPPRPAVHTLTILSNLTEYIGMVGAIVAVTLGYNAMIREKDFGTLKLILSRPVYRDRLLTGKLLGNASVIAVLLAIVFVFNLVLVVVVGRVWPSPNEVLRLFGLVAIGFLYMLMFLVLSVVLSIRMKEGSAVLLISLVIWMLVAFVVPQLADALKTNSTVINGISGAVTQIPQDTFASRTVDFLSPTWHLHTLGNRLLEVTPPDGSLGASSLFVSWLSTALVIVAPSTALTAAGYLLLARDETMVLE